MATQVITTKKKQKQKQQQQQQQQQKQDYNIVTLFSGCGGSALGYKSAGFKILLAVEFIEPAREVFHLNFPDTIILKDDIRTISASTILKSIGLKVGELDLLDGSPPCSAFTTAGRREKSWNKPKEYSEGVFQRVDDLHFEFIRLLKDMQPKTFVCENVPALTQGYARGYFNEILRSMKAAGYNVKACMMNAMYYGVPQRRYRIFFVGVRKDLNIQPSFPKPSNRIVTVKDVIKDVKNQKWELDEAYKINEYIRKWLVKLKPGQKGSNIHPRGSFFNLERLSFNTPSPTILTIGRNEKNTKKSLNNKRSGPIHPLENRYLTISEVKRLSSFPDDFKLTGNFIQQWERLGRAVPPRMMEKIALHVKKNILDIIPPPPPQPSLPNASIR